MTTGLGISIRIQDALIRAGVDRDMCSTTESGAVQVREVRVDSEPLRLDVTVGQLRGGLYAAFDNRGERNVHGGGNLRSVSKAVAAHVAIEKAGK